ncbi:MAG TPA: EthD family reductase [bacterium]|nr:EthD family reductase [bacterium]
MYKVSVMYPNEDGVKFDLDYYRSKHMKLVEEHMKPFGLQRTGVDKGISGGAGQKAPYVCVGTLYFDRPDGYDEAIKKAGPALREDIANFTNVTPTRLISEVVE